MGKKDRPVPKPPQDAAPAQEAFDMVFHCQLAHGSPTRQVRDFTNVKQLYESIAKAFSVDTKEILYCTLNTHKVDMTRLLGGQIGLDDFLFAHVKGNSKTVKVNKDGVALGLTISDNGAGYAFIKKIRDDSIMSKVANVSVGDHIAAINGEDMTQSRHFEVAKKLKEIPLNTEFTLQLVEPKSSELDKVQPRQAMGGTGTVESGGGKKTLRMRRDGTAAVEELPSDAIMVRINKIDDLLENFIGIKDQELATTIFHLAKEAKDEDSFVKELDSALGDFEFTADFVLDAFEEANK